MIDIIQIYKSVEIIEKSDYDSVSRQNIGVWDSFVSKTGFLKDETITLPIESKNDPSIKNADLIIIQDKNNSNTFKNNIQLKVFNILSKPWFFEIFEFKKTNECIEIWLKSDTIVFPKRENHKIAELNPSKSIRFKINGKDDFTMSGNRKQRTFSEYDYILEYLGTADKIDYKELNKIETIKKISLDNCKVIDERKILY